MTTEHINPAALKAMQVNLFADLPADTRSMLLQLANIKKTVPESQVVAKPDVEASPVMILLGVCRSLDVLPAELRSESYKRDYSLARFIAMYILRTNGYSTTGIGILFKRRHTTVIYAGNTHRDLMEYNAAYKAKYWLVVNHIKAQAVEEAAAV